jgi:hypothetical protein
MSRIRNYAAFACLCWLLTACAAMGIIKPESFDERLAAAYSLNTAIREGANASLNSGALSSAEAQEVLEETRNARSVLDGIRGLASTDPATAEGRLKLMEGLLQRLRSRLIAKGVTITPKPVEVTP